MRSNYSLTLAIPALMIGLEVSAFFMVNVPLPAWSYWFSGLNVILFAWPAFWATRRWLGWTDAIVLWVILGVYALLIETSAIFTGFPYGHFGYSELLGTKLFGVTPWTVFLAWTPLIVGAYAIARVCFANAVVRIASTAVIATAFDLVLDPGAVKLGFWKYADSSGFYGVPLSNFVGWLVTGLIAAVLIEVFLYKVKPLLRVPVQLVSSSFLIVFFWTAISVFGAMVWPATIGIGIVSALALFWIRNYYRFDEMIVLVAEDGKPLATQAKATVHNNDTRLHSAFSVFLFNDRDELLLQQRALSKKTWPGVWSNSCCGHVMLHEKTMDAAKRRLKFELGLAGVELELMLPDFRYRAEKDGVVENEICPVFVGRTGKLPKPNVDEVAETKWVDWEEFRSTISQPESGISPWAVEEVELLAASEDFQNFSLQKPAR